MSFGTYFQQAKSTFNLKSKSEKNAIIAVGALSITTFLALWVWSRKQEQTKHDGIHKPIPIQESRGVWGMLNGEFRDNFLPDMDEATKKHGAIYAIGSRVFQSVIVNDPDLIKEIARKRHAFGASFFEIAETMMPATIQCNDERLWAKRRKALVHGLRACHLGSLTPEFLRFFNEKASSFPTTPMDFNSLLKQLVFTSFARIAIGQHIELDKLPEMFKTWSNEFLWRAVLRYKFLYEFPCPRYWRFLEAESYMRERIEAVQYGDQSNDSVLARVLEYSATRETDEERLDQQEVFDLILMIFLAGYDTTANAIGFTLMCLANNGEVQEALYRQLREHGLPLPRDELTSDVLEAVVRDCKYLGWVTSEGMRHYPVGIGMSRSTLHDVEVGPYLIDKGVNILGNTWSSRFSRELWGENAEEFFPERWGDLDKELITKNSFFPFGVGSRDCPGQRFAVLEMRLVVALFLHRFVLRPVKDKPVQPFLDTVVSSKNGFWLKLENRV